MIAESLLFWIFAGVTCFGAIAVVVSQNVVRMAFWLIVSLGSTAGLFFLLHADFVAATQLLVYVGGTLVLLIFGVMLTASGPFLNIKTSPAEGILAAVIGALLLAMIVSTLPSEGQWEDASVRLTGRVTPGGAPRGYNNPEEGNTARRIGLKLVGISTEDIGAALGKQSTGYLLPFEIVSVHLLVVLIGAAYLARAKRRTDSAPESTKG